MGSKSAAPAPPSYRYPSSAAMPTTVCLAATTPTMSTAVCGSTAAHPGDDDGGSLLGLGLLGALFGGFGGSNDSWGGGGGSFSGGGASGEW